jgi:CheY-like chemotaxis protein
MRIAIVDDDKIARDTLASMLREVGFEPFIVEKPFTNVEELAHYIQENSEEVICDHRLSPYGLATFTGSELMRSLYTIKIPSILMTQYSETDINVSIRKHRDKIPVVLERDDLVDLDTIADRINKGFKTCSQEFQGMMSSARRPHRTLINIIGITSDSGEEVAEVFIPSWNPYRAVRFPVSQITQELLSIVKLHVDTKKSAWLIARVNTGAEKADELYFTVFESAPEVDENDGLA